jgi:hypothetical protein
VSATSAPETDPLADAHAIAKAHHLFILERRDRVYDRRERCHREVTVWIVYRRSAHGAHVRLGKRRDPAELLRFVRRCV